MSEERFEKDCDENVCSFDYSTLDTYYEYNVSNEEIIEWNKHSSNAQYRNLKHIAEILNIKQMRLESLMKHREEVGKLFDRIDEQQATISALKEENEQLRGINKEIGDDLYNCRLNKDIVSEKLKLWQDTLAEYDIYTIKDFEESFELDAKINKEKDEKIKELEVKVLNLELEIKRLEEENRELRLELETHKHPLWSTREAEKKVNKLADSLADEVNKNGLLNEEINQLRIENMRLKKKGD